MGFHVIIPARYNSVRLPGKPLLDIAGKPMIQRVHENAIKSGAASVVIATDDLRIQKVAEGFGASVCMTSSDHESGTERLSEAAAAMALDDDEIVVNLQGDQPFLSESMIRLVAEDLAQYEGAKVSSVCHQIDNVEDLFSPDVVKVIMNKRNYALYFSRAPIPWDRDGFVDKENYVMEVPFYRHVGVYAYKAGFLQDYVQQDECGMERLEKLEQLRVLWCCRRIHMAVTKEPIPIEINTPEDLEQAQSFSLK